MLYGDDVVVSWLRSERSAGVRWGRSAIDCDEVEGGIDGEEDTLVRLVVGLNRLDFDSVVDKRYEPCDLE